VAGARVSRATYRAFSAERLDCWLAVHVGLGHVNVTLTGKLLQHIILFQLALSSIVIKLNK
jgi:uncharacterized protein YqgC (DUF456 family)